MTSGLKKELPILRKKEKGKKDGRRERGIAIKKTSAALFFVLIVSFISAGSEAAASWPQEREDEVKAVKPAADRIGQAYLIQFKEDFFHLLTSPREWQGPDIMNLAAIFGTGTVFFTLDQDIFNWVAERRSSFSQDLARIFTKAGDGAWLLGFCGTLYGLGEIFKKPHWRRTALLSLESLAISSASVASLKFLIGRSRPHAWEGSQSFHPFSTSSRYTSFPSGHACAAFSVAASIAGESKSRSIDILVYSVATLAAVARVHDEAHWASDVLVGSALGYFIGRGVVNLHRQEKRRFSFQVYPLKEGLAASFCFSLD